MPFMASWNLGRWGRRVVKECACACRSNRGPTRDSQPSDLRAAAMCGQGHVDGAGGSTAGVRAVACNGNGYLGARLALEQQQQHIEHSIA
jgi:hypothetical protein